MSPNPIFGTYTETKTKKDYARGIGKPIVKGANISF